MEGKLGENHAAEQRLETAQAKGERIVAEMGRLGLTEQELRARRKCDQLKLEVAARLRTETTLTVKNIAARLALGTPRNASVRLQEWKQKHGTDKPQKTKTGM